MFNAKPSGEFRTSTSPKRQTRLATLPANTPASIIVTDPDDTKASHGPLCRAPEDAGPIRA
jgi:hypothetical protein